MVYLHEAPYGENLVRHWANEVASPKAKGYENATYKIRKVGTGIEYDDAVDVAPCRFEYAATDKKIGE